MQLSTQQRLAGLFFAVAQASAGAADSAPPPPPPAPSAARVAEPLAAARAAIKAQRWPAALQELQKLNTTGSADWHNLMGFTLRKQAQPDLDAAQRHYDEALRLDPKHQGALEYSGELALMKGDLATAEARLAALSKLCNSPCEPLDDLKKSVARYKASGKS